MSITETIWLVIGFGGQGLFFARWIVQWFRSERERESTIPLSFWYLSLIGGLITLTYAIYRRSPVYITSLSVRTVIYLRNQMLIFRKFAPTAELIGSSGGGAAFVGGRRFSPSSVPPYSS